MAKRKGKEIQEDLMRNDHAIIPDDKSEATFSDENIFLDDTPYVRPINEKFDKDGLYLFQHIVIFHLATLAGYFPDDQFPHVKVKCFQYYKDRNLESVGVNPETFYKSYSEFIQLDIEDGNRIITREKFISYSFIDTITPFIEKWYPHAILFVQTLNASPYKLEPIYYYWIYRAVRSKYRGSREDFRMEYCAHIPKETFRTWQKRYSKDETPDDLKEYIQHFIHFHFSFGGEPG
ncbi:MAG: hypothetical protein IPQ04_09450 [Saprospiraceae bacterium]|nr:hypothetical protein [Saprospiraceae bacterium]